MPATISASPAITTRSACLGRIRVWTTTPSPPVRLSTASASRHEIITYVRSGAITHQDSLGNKGRTGGGDVQVMSAGKGVTHAEYNLEDVPTTLFQIWIESDEGGVEPGWGAMPFPKNSRDGQFQLLASGDPADGTLTVHADARLLGANLRRARGSSSR